MVERWEAGHTDYTAGQVFISGQRTVAVTPFGVEDAEKIAAMHNALSPYGDPVKVAEALSELVEAVDAYFAPLTVAIDHATGTPTFEFPERDAERVRDALAKLTSTKDVPPQEQEGE